VSSTGEEIRRIANEIESLDPGMAPVFTGFEDPSGTGKSVRGLFQGGVVLGYDASLEHARRLLAETRERLEQQRQEEPTPETQPFKPGDYGQYVCVGRNRVCGNRRDISHDGVWVKYGTMFSSAHRTCV